MSRLGAKAIGVGKKMKIQVRHVSRRIVELGRLPDRESEVQRPYGSRRGRNGASGVVKSGIAEVEEVRVAYMPREMLGGGKAAGCL